MCVLIDSFLDVRENAVGPFFIGPPGISLIDGTEWLLVR